MNNKHKTILHLCADIGSDTKPYREMGYNVILVGSDIGVENYHPPLDVYGIIANPPCTHFSIARTVSKTPRDLNEGMRLVKECLRIIWECQARMPLESRSSYLKFWMIENPASGFLKYFIGKPQFEYSPHEYGAPYTKRTGIWGYFNKPKKPFMEFPLLEKCNSLAGGKNAHTNLLKYKGTSQEKRKQQMHDRSMCYEKFAEEFFYANQ